jgi:O-antigen ligase
MDRPLFQLDAILPRVSLKTLIMLLALVVAPLFGIGIAAATRGQPTLLLGIGGVLGIFVTLFAPIELMVLGGVLGSLLADSWLVPGDAVYYARFAPMGMLAMRTLIDIALRRIPRVRVERAFVYPGFAFMGLAFISAIYSITPNLTFQRTLSMAFVIVAFGLGLPNYLTTFQRLDGALKLVILLIAAFVLVGSLFAGGGDQNAVYLDQSYLRIRGLFANPNTQGLMAMLMFYPIVWWWRTEPKGVRKYALAILVVVWGLLVLLAGSRASLIGVLCGALALSLLYGRSSFRYASVLFIGLAIAIVFALVLPEYGRALEFNTPTETITQQQSQLDLAQGILPEADRAFLIQRALELGMRSPIIGVGFSASDKVFVDDHVVLITEGIYVSGSHNSYTRMFVDLGIVGVLVGFIIFIAILARVWLSSSPVRRDLTVALLTATVVTGLVNAFFEDWLYGFGSASTLPFWFFLALIPIRLSQLQNAEPHASEVIS